MMMILGRVVGRFVVCLKWALARCLKNIFNKNFGASLSRSD